MVVSQESPGRREMSVRARATLLLIGFGVAVAVIAAWCASFLRTSPPTVSARTVSTASGKQAYVDLQTVGSIGYGARPTWVSYLVRDTAGRWVHTTKFTVPAHALIHVTIDQYDSAGALRNARWAHVAGTVGGVETITGYVGNKSVTNANYSTVGTSDPGHTFAIPALGVNVPLTGLPAKISNLCPVAPCTAKWPRDVITFSFRTDRAGIYRWQCFVPCALNFLDGNSGPMQTLGFMMGFMDVVQ